MNRTTLRNVISARMNPTISVPSIETSTTMSRKGADNTMKTKQKRCAFSTLHTLTGLVAIGTVLAVFAGYAGELTGNEEAQLINRAVTPATKLNKACVAQRCRLLNVVALRTNRRLSTAPRHNFFVTMSGRSNLRRHRREDSITLKTCSLIPRRLKLQTFIGFVHTKLQGPVPRRSPNQQARRSLRVH